MPRPIPSPTASWRYIDAWLAAHAAPELALLNPPASADEIHEAEQLLGIPLPHDLAESLRCHNGTSAWTTLLPEPSPLPLSRIVDHWQMCMDIAASCDGLTVRPWEDEPWWHPLWVPWAQNASGAAQVIDQRPGPDAGRLGWAGHSGGGDFSDSWPDLASLLHAVATALRKGGGVRGQYPYLTARSELWWDEEGRQELNGASVAPAPIGLP